MIEEKVADLKKKLADYVSLVVDMVKKSIQGLIEKDERILKDVLEEKEPMANDFEIEIDEICTTLIVKYQPKAKDLRTILMLFKMNNDLERIADHAVNISQSALALLGLLMVDRLTDIPKMAGEVIKMLNDGVDAFINEDARLAKSVCERDAVIDNLRDKIIKGLITSMTADP